MVLLVQICAPILKVSDGRQIAYNPSLAHSGRCQIVAWIIYSPSSSHNSDVMKLCYTPLLQDLGIATTHAMARSASPPMIYLFTR